MRRASRLHPLVLAPPLSQCSLGAVKAISPASHNQKGLARFQAMDLTIDSDFDGILPRRKQDLPDFEDIIGQNKPRPHQSRQLP